MILLVRRRGRIICFFPLKSYKTISGLSGRCSDGELPIPAFLNAKVKRDRLSYKRRIKQKFMVEKLLVAFIALSDNMRRGYKDHLGALHPAWKQMVTTIN